MIDELTLKQRAFVNHLCLNGFNATKAANEAGYSKKSAYAEGSRLLKNVKIQEAIDENLRAAGITKEKIQRELDLLAFSDISKILDVKNGSVYVTDFSKIPQHIRRQIKSVQETKDGLKIVLYGKERALEILAKWVGAIDEKPIVNIFNYEQAKKIKDDLNNESK